MIRKVLPSLIAQEIVGVQPMGFSTPVCSECMILGKETGVPEHPWKCICCNDFNLNGTYLGYTVPIQKIIGIRTKIFEDRVMTDMKVSKTLYRKFMYPDDSRDPNERYRQWLEQNVGQQGVMWNWGLAITRTFDILEIEFADSEHATLFELTFT